MLYKEVLMKRIPAVAGQFYRDTASGLTEEVSGYVDKNHEKEKIIGCVCPHAGLIYSGTVAGSIYSLIEMPHTLILIGPNHTGWGKPISIMPTGTWQIPTGTLTINEELARKIISGSERISEDTQAHMYEHSLEVQLPFILFFSQTVKIVPITMMSTSIADCKEIGLVLADIIKEIDYSVTIVASSDMSHFERDEITRIKDKKAIDKILALDPVGLHETVREYDISMCGYAPTTAMLFAACHLGAHKAELIKYMTSGDVSGDYERVVGYAGIIVK
jgi:AmmeMemoRadiSam system protein B